MANSEAFGLNAVAAVTDSLALGNNARALNNPGNIAIGRNAFARSDNANRASLAIGVNATASATWSSMAIGADTYALGMDDIVIGGGSTSTGGKNIVIGWYSDPGAFSSAILLGREATAFRHHQMVIGGSCHGNATCVRELRVGTAEPWWVHPAHNFTIFGGRAFGSNRDGADLAITGGPSTGQGTGGRLLLQTVPAALTSNTTENDPVTRMTFLGSGLIGVGLSTPTTAFDLSGTLRIANGGEACDGTTAGAIRYSGGALSFCNGTAWTTLGSAGAADWYGLTNIPTQVQAVSNGTVISMTRVSATNVSASALQVGNAGGCNAGTAGMMRFTDTGGGVMKLQLCRP
jgi:hypothetical protein